MLLSRKALQRVLGVLWLIDGLLQLQPRMFTGDMINGVMRPMLQGQPGLLEPSLQYIVTQTTLHLTAVNLLITIVPGPARPRLPLAPRALRKSPGDRLLCVGTRRLVRG